MSRRKPRKCPPKLQRMEMKELEAILDRAQSSALCAEDHGKLKAVVETLAWLTGELQKKTLSLARLRQLFGMATSEKTRQVLGKEGRESDESKDAKAQDDDEKSDEGTKKAKPKGHGRNGADAYKGAEKIRIPHPSLKSGDLCPECEEGKAYNLPKPSVLVRVRGTAPFQATVYEREGLRCNLCGKVFWAPAPEGIGEKKYDETSASMIALLKYGSGLPFNRLQRLVRNLGIPLPAATQWDIVANAAQVVAAACQELIRQAAQGQVLYNDDTTMKILELMKENEQLESSKERTGMFTSGVVSTYESRRIALFFTGRKHAGENLAQVLEKRAAQLAAPIQMCDGLDRNIPKEFETVLANCLTHGRRKFVEVVDSFPEQCQHMLKLLAKVYKNDATTRKKNMLPEQRLQFHRTHSAEPMKELERWMKEQIEEKKVEPNCSLGKAISYMLKRWDKLTLFLRQPGAPLDNNLCERALKKAILHRKNALFYKTKKGARVGDIFMSLIYTAELSGANPFEYLTEIQKHEDELKRSPQDWMPWNYQAALGALAEKASSRS